MRCRLCGSEAGRIQEGEGLAFDCPRCGPHWIGFLVVREVLRQHAEPLSLAVRELNAAGRPRVEVRGEADIRRLLADAEALELVGSGR